MQTELQTEKISISKEVFNFIIGKDPKEILNLRKQNNLLDLNVDKLLQDKIVHKTNTLLFRADLGRNINISLNALSAFFVVGILPVDFIPAVEKSPIMLLPASLVYLAGKSIKWGYNQKVISSSQINFLKNVEKRYPQD